MEKMSRHPVPCNPSFLPAATHGVLKSLLENPMKLPLHHEGEVGKEKVSQLLIYCLYTEGEGVLKRRGLGKMSVSVILNV